MIFGKKGIGETVIGEALVANDNFSARYDLDREKGVFSRKLHKLYNQSYVDKILVLNSAKGGVATSWMLRNMKLNNKSPKALILNSTNPIMVQAVAFADITLIHNFDTDITSYFKTGDTLNINPYKACVYKI
jgi:predicted aconitase with swiveling domain|tara:strand:- start:699 stop:1094 length:396 start_codon:yes stop_codon:yes gene_type:complete